MATIPEYFADQSVLITGATGFVGKILVEKMLRSCPDVKRLFLLVRPKKGVSPQERWNKLTDIPIFDKLKKMNPKALDKVLLINCDIGKSDLGLSESDRQFLIENTTVMYHNAATVQFSNSVPESLKLNTRSTYALLEMAKLMPNLKAYVHVSTAYANIDNPDTEWKEKVYPTLQDWRSMLKLLDTEDYALSVLQDKIVGRHPNPYTFTKRLAENVVAEYSNFFPVIICRPSVVISTAKEPFPGWSEGVNAYVALTGGVALGILRVARCTLDSCQDIIPVDTTARALIAAPWRQNRVGSKKGLIVYNVTYGEKLKIQTKQLMEFLNDRRSVASKYMVWCPNIDMVSNMYSLYLLGFVKMVVPFYLLDKILELSTGAKPRLIPIIKRAYTTYFTLKDLPTMQILFPNENYDKLNSSLDPKDKDDFNLDLHTTDPHEEIRKNFISFLKYYLKEDVTEESIIKNNERRKKYEMVSSSVTVLFYGLSAWIATNCLMATDTWRALSAAADIYYKPY